MLKSYFLVAWRSIAKNKVSSFINIFGLSVGMTVAIFNGLWVWDEYSYNKYHEHYDRIGQVMSRYTHDGESSLNSNMSYPLALELKNHYTDNFEHYVITSSRKEGILSTGEKQISGTGEYMDSDAPEMLTLKMIHGTRSGLKDPHSILLSASLARSLFGDTDPVNRMIKINNHDDVKVTGVYENLPLNTEFTKDQFVAPFELWLSDNSWVQNAAQDWTNHFLKVYAEIKSTSSFAKVSASIENAERSNARFFKNASFQDERDLLYPMSQWHLYTPFRGKISAEPIHMVRLVGLTGIAVLLLACINFMNLSTARSEKRAREVGIRKTIGSGRLQLINQFFSESLLVVLFAYLFALGLVILFLPAFNQLASKQIAIPWTNYFFWKASLIFIILTGLLAGSYPALYLSSFSPVKVLKGSFRVGRLASLPREVMVVTQFSISIILVICTLLVYRQIQFAKSRPVGYDRDRIISMNMKSDDFYGKYDLLRTELKKTGAVVEMSESMGRITEIGSNNGGFEWKGMDPKQKQDFGTITVTPSFGKTINWKLIEGRDFSDNNISDSFGVILTESAVKKMGLKNPVGENIRWTFWATHESKNYKVLGVVKDMVMQSPYEPVLPTIFFIKSLNAGVDCIDIKIADMPMAEALSKIEKVFRKIIPSAPFEYQFVDEDYARKFKAEQLVGRLATVFGVLAVFISCLGLFGLVSFVAEQRIREIGIRKILGASVFNLWQLLSTRFVMLVSISFLIASPLAFMIMHEWIQKYSYRTNLSPWIFIIAGMGALGITIFTVSFQSIKAALSNPVESLRIE
jgi:putative ABC transport system permease protein